MNLQQTKDMIDSLENTSNTLQKLLYEIFFHGSEKEASKSIDARENKIIGYNKETRSPGMKA